MEKNVQNDLSNEISNLEIINHENLIHLVDKRQTSNNFYLIFDLCNGGTLQNLLNKVKCFKEPQARFIIKQIINGVSYLHRKNIVHRDLKCDNVIIHFQDLEQDEDLNPQMSKSARERKQLEYFKQFRYQVKIADLGFSKLLENQQEEMLSYAGTPVNMSPEIMRYEPYTYKTDIWSIGVMLFQMIVGKYPFLGFNKQNLLNTIQRGFYNMSKSQKISLVCLDFIIRCLQFQASNRIEWDQITNHPFIRDDGEYLRIIMNRSLNSQYEFSFFQSSLNEDLNNNNNSFQQEQLNQFNSILLNCQNLHVVEIDDQRNRQQEESKEEQRQNIMQMQQRQISRQYSFEMSSKRVNLQIEVLNLDGSISGQVIENWHDREFDPSVVENDEEGLPNSNISLQAESNFVFLQGNKGKIYSDIGEFLEGNSPGIRSHNQGIKKSFYDQDDGINSFDGILHRVIDQNPKRDNNFSVFEQSLKQEQQQNQSVNSQCIGKDTSSIQLNNASSTFKFKYSNNNLPQGEAYRRTGIVTNNNYPSQSYLSGIQLNKQFQGTNEVLQMEIDEEENKNQQDLLNQPSRNLIEAYLVEDQQKRLQQIKEEDDDEGEI